MNDKSLGELIREYQATVERLPASLGGYAAMSQNDRNQVRDDAFELHTQIYAKKRDARHLTWFGVKV